MIVLPDPSCGVLQHFALPRFYRHSMTAFGRLLPVVTGGYGSNLGSPDAVKAANSMLSWLAIR